jgi:dihydrofolate reductase
MRKVIFGVANSLDSFIARRDHGYDWIMWSDEVSALMAEFWPKIDTVVVGRKTYDVMRQQSGAYEGSMPGVKTYVFSRTPSNVDDPNVEIISQDAGEFIRDLKRQPGKDFASWAAASWRARFWKPTSSMRSASTSIPLFWATESLYSTRWFAR